MSNGTSAISDARPIRPHHSNDGCGMKQNLKPLSGTRTTGILSYLCMDASNISEAVHFFRHAPSTTSPSPHPYKKHVAPPHPLGPVRRCSSMIRPVSCAPVLGFSFHQLQLRWIWYGRVVRGGGDDSPLVTIRPNTMTPMQSTSRPRQVVWMQPTCSRSSRTRGCRHA